MEALRAEFEGIAEWEERYARLMAMGRALPAFPEPHRIDANLIRGCQSRVWMFPEAVDGRVHFHVDSDALITKGLAAFLVSIYQDLPAQEILATEPVVLTQLELARHLSPTRANGLGAMLKQMKLYAFALAHRSTSAP